MGSEENLNVSVFGLGYVGCVSLCCLAESGHKVIGVDVNETKLEQVNSGVPTIYEPGLSELMKSSHQQGMFEATNNVEYAVTNSTISMITVGTPSLPDGELDLSFIFKVAEQIGMALRNIERFHVLAIRSTVKPGTCKQISKIVAQISGKTADEDFAVVVNPEFLREGKAIKDYKKPPYVLIGSDNDKATDLVSSLYKTIDAEVIAMQLSSAEIIKYINNSWHAVKVAFGNEVGSVCKSLGINSQEVMDVFVRDRDLNISPVYLRPGFAYGGSCLPKDLSGFTTLAGLQGVSVPMLDNVKASNEQHILRAVELIRSKASSKKISVFGLTFKEGTDDLRNSPTLDVVRVLLKQGYEVKVFDKDVNSALSTGINSQSTLRLLGEVSDTLCESSDELMSHSDLLVIAKRESIISEMLNASPNKTVVDLVYLGAELEDCKEYEGLAW